MDQIPKVVIWLLYDALDFCHENEQNSSFTAASASESHFAHQWHQPPLDSHQEEEPAWPTKAKEKTIQKPLLDDPIG